MATRTRCRRAADIVLIGVKPVMVPDLLREIAPVLRPGTIIVSLAAGVTIATFASIVGEEVSVIRSMPNTPRWSARR
jgi:pyrroline-5-carboxylate reductase